MAHILLTLAHLHRLPVQQQIDYKLGHLSTKATRLGQPVYLTKLSVPKMSLCLAVFTAVTVMELLYLASIVGLTSEYLDVLLIEN